MESNYKGFCEHVQEYNSKGIPIGTKDLLRLAHKYNCEPPKTQVLI